MAENSEIKRLWMEHMATKKVMIISPDPNIRSLVKAASKNLAIDSKFVQTYSDYSEACHQLKSFSPEIIILDLQSNQETCLKILKVHLKMFPNKSESASIIIGKGAPSSDFIHAQRFFADCFIQKPISQDSLVKSIKTCLLEKLLLSSEEKYLHSKISSYFENEFFNEQTKESTQEDYLQLITELKSSTKQTPLSLYVQGRSYYLNGNIKEAKELYQEGLNLDPLNYNCLNGLLEAHIQSKDFKEIKLISSKLVKNYPINPTHLPHIAKSFVSTESFEELTNFVDTYISFEKLETMINETYPGSKLNEKTIINTINQIGICLLAAAKYCSINHGSELAEEIINKCFNVTHLYAPKICNQAINELANMGKVDKALELANQMPPESKGPELRVIEILADKSDTPAGAVISNVMDLINQGVKDVRLYDLAIKKSIEIQRRPSTIEELITDAIGLFPNMNQHFSRLRQQIK